MHILHKMHISFNVIAESLQHSTYKIKEYHTLRSPYSSSSIDMIGLTADNISEHGVCGGPCATVRMYFDRKGYSMYNRNV